MASSVDDYRWLVSEAAEPWLDVAQHDLAAIPAVIGKLRKELSAERAHLVAETLELRRRAREKFSLADKMFFTSKGLQQATDEALAAYKAARFPASGPLADLCCGIGGDLLAMAGRSDVTGVDADAIAAELAAANLLASNAPRCSGRIDVADAAQTAVDGFAAWHCDPDRRAEGRRTTTMELFSPALHELDRLLVCGPQAAIKLAPATIAPADWSARAELEWLGSRGECRQQVAWFGGLARYPGQRTATIVEGGAVRTVVGAESELPPVAAACGKYVFEPHAAVIAAKLTAGLCAEHGLASLHAGVAYLTGEALIHDVALAAFEVVDTLPFDRKQLKAYCRERGLGRLEIKKRGVELQPEQLRKEIAVQGDGEATIIVTPLGKRVRAIVARRP